MWRCSDNQAIMVWLWLCQTAVEIVEGKIQCKITYNEVICSFGENLFAHYITNITASIVYKDWLLHSLQNKKRVPQINVTYFEHEINLRLKIYDKAKLRYQKVDQIQP